MVHSFVVYNKDADFGFAGIRAASWHGGGGWRGGGAAGDFDLESLGTCPASRAPSALELGFGIPVQGNSSWPIASLQLISAIVGVGVLALPNAVSWLGWLMGPLVIVAFYFVTLGSSMLLVDVYKAGGGKHQRYLDAVLDILGPRHAAALVTCQMLALSLACIALMIAGIDALRMVAQYACQYTNADHCIDKQWIMALLFGGLQIPLSQLPNLESIWIVSAMGAASSVGYCLIGLALGAFNAQGFGSLWGRHAPRFVKAMKVFEAIGDVSVAYFCAFVIFEVQATIKSRTPGGAATGMRKAIGTALTLAFSLFISVGSAGYSALGAATPGSMLNAKFPNTPSWVPLAANVLIVLQMISSFQLHAQLIYANTEAACHALIASCTALAHSGTAGRGTAAPPPIPGGGPRERTAVRAVVRTLLVATATLVAVCVPSFSGVVGLIGGVLNFTVAVLYPTLTWVKALRPRRALCAVLIAINVVLLLVALGATVGSIFEIVVSSQGGLLSAALKAARRKQESNGISIGGH